MRLQQFKPKAKQCDILILTGSIGSGHISAAKAITEAIYRNYGREFKVETIDLISTLKTFLTKAAKTIYLSSLRISPKIYELAFAQSSESEWPLKFLNTISTPFMQKKFLELLKQRQPSILISTFPIWDILAKKVWQKYSHGKLPFISVVTDSINVHNCWTAGNPDYFLVANEDTKTALQNLGIAEKRIRAFGYPVLQRFCKHGQCEQLHLKLNLSPKKNTLLLILGVGIKWTKVKKIIAIIQKSALKNMQLVIVACANKKWINKLEKFKWPWPTHITGWTNEMHTFIHGADIVLTKAGGATVMECIASKKPMIIIEAIPGQEIGNAMLVQKYNIGVILNHDFSNFDHAVRYILNNKILIEKNLAAQQKPHATEEIAQFLVSLLGYVHMP